MLIIVASDEGFCDVTLYCFLFSAEDWKASLKLPPPDTRYQTEVLHTILPINACFTSIAIDDCILVPPDLCSWLNKNGRLTILWTLKIMVPAKNNM